MEHHLTWVIALVAALGIGSQWLAWRLRVPAIVLLTLAGLIAGPGLGWLKPSTDFGALLLPIIKLGVAVILFEGGLNLKLHEFRETALAVRRLVSVGVVLSWLLGSSAAHYIGGLSWPVALVFGAIVVVTGPTVIMPLLRHARLRRRPASLLKWEGIINDPIGALLAVLIVQYVVATDIQAGIGGSMLYLGLILLGSAAIGAGAGFLLGYLFHQGHIPEFLKGPVSLMFVFAVYGVANLIQEEAGLMATTIFGLVIANLSLPSIDELRRMKEYVTILLVSAVFVLLTADVDPAILVHLDWHSAALLGAVVFLVRPVTVLAATINAGLDWRERALIAWIAPRGIVAAAVAGIFAPRMVEQGYADAELLVPLVFSLILITVTLHGFSIGWVARRLNLAAASPHGVLIVGASPWSIELARVLQQIEVPAVVVDSSWHRLKPARLGGVPVFFGEILSETSEQSLELNDIAYVLAATDNDAYNALVCMRFAPELGRNHVFQLPMVAADEKDPKGLLRSMRGVPAFHENALYDMLLRRHYQGWRFQRTRITEEYPYERYLAVLPEGAVPMLLVREGGDVVINSPRAPFKPKPGDVIVSFQPVSEEDNAARAGRRAAERASRADESAAEDSKPG